MNYCSYEIGTISFTVRVTDSKGNSSVQAVDIDVMPPYSLVDVYTVENSNQNDLPGPEVVDVYVEGSSVYVAVNGAGLAISDDGGTSWEYITSESGLFDDYVYSMLVDGSTIYLGHWGGLSVSTDSGVSWDTYDYKGTQIEYEWIKDIKLIDGDVFLATLEGIAKSSDNGNTITVYNSANGLPKDSSDRENVEALAWDGTSLYAACDSGGIYESADGGTTWSQIYSSIDDVTHILSKDSTLYIGARDGLYVTPDGGTSWTQEGFGNGTTFLYSNSDGVWAGSYDEGFNFSDDGFYTFTQTKVADGLISGEGSGFYADGSNWIYSTDAGISISTDSGSSWNTIDSGTGLSNNKIKDLEMVGSTLVAATAYGGIVLFEDDGESWNTTQSIPPYVEGSVIHDTTIGSLYVTDTHLWADNHKTDDLGITWTTFDKDTNGIEHYNLYDLTSYEDKVFAATASGVSVTSNGGTNWITYNSADGLPDDSVRRVFHDGNRLYAGFYSDGLAYSDDDSASWSSFSNFPGQYVYSIYEFDGVIYTGTYYEGIVYSNDDGHSWSIIDSSDGLPDNTVYSLYADTNSLYIGTASGFAFSSDDGTHWWNLTVQDGLLNADVRDVFVDGEYVYLGTELGVAVLKRN